MIVFHVKTQKDGIIKALSSRDKIHLKVSLAALQSRPVKTILQLK